MQQVRIQKWNKRLAVLVGAALAASGLLSAFQPASATDAIETAAASARIQQGDFDIWFGVQEHGGSLVCARIINVVTGERHGSCGSGFPVEVSDTLDYARGAGTTTWTVYSPNKGRNPKTGGYSSKSGTITVDMTWAGNGELQTHVSPDYHGPLFDPECVISFEYYCSGGYVDASQTRTGTARGTITDSEWGTFVIEGASGSAWQALI